MPCPQIAVFTFSFIGKTKQVETLHCIFVGFQNQILYNLRNRLQRLSRLLEILNDFS